MGESILHDIGSFFMWICTPMGFGSQLGQYGWVFVVAAVTGLIAKENVISTFYVLASAIGLEALGVPGEDGESGIGIIAAFLASEEVGITWQGLISFCIFNMLTIPCFAAAATIKGELPKGKFKYTVAFWMLTSYITSSLIYVMFSWWWTAFIVAVLAALVIAYFVLRNKGKINFGKGRKKKAARKE